MKPAEIIAMAREAGFRTGKIDLFSGEPIAFITPASATTCIHELVRFADLVAAKAAADERAACAQVYDRFDTGRRLTSDFKAQEMAAAIRARGDQS